LKFSEVSKKFELLFTDFLLYRELGDELYNDSLYLLGDVFIDKKNRSLELAKEDKKRRLEYKKINLEKTELYKKIEPYRYYKYSYSRDYRCMIVDKESYFNEWYELKIEKKIRDIEYRIKKPVEYVDFPTCPSELTLKGKYNYIGEKVKTRCLKYNQ